MNVANVSPSTVRPLVDVVPVPSTRPGLSTEYALQRVGAPAPSSIRFPTATEAVLAALGFAQVRNVENTTSSPHGFPR